MKSAIRFGLPVCLQPSMERSRGERYWSLLKRVLSMHCANLLIYKLIFSCLPEDCVCSILSQPRMQKSLTLCVNNSVSMPCRIYFTMTGNDKNRTEHPAEFHNWELKLPPGLCCVQRQDINSLNNNNNLKKPTYYGALGA